MGLGFKGLGFKFKVYCIKVTLCGEGIVMIHPKFAAVEMSVGQSELISGLNRNTPGVIPASSRRTVSVDEMSVDMLVAYNQQPVQDTSEDLGPDLNDVQCRILAKHVGTMNRLDLRPVHRHQGCSVEGVYGSGFCFNSKWGFPKIRGAILGVPIRIIAFWGLYRVLCLGKLPNV